MSKISPYVIALIAEGMSYDLNEAGPKKYITKSLKNKILDILVHHPGEFSSDEIARMLGDVSSVAVRKAIKDLHDDPSNAHLWNNIRGGPTYHQPGNTDTDFLKDVEDPTAMSQKSWDYEPERPYDDQEGDDDFWDAIDQYDEPEEMEPTPPPAPSFRPRRGDSQARFSSFADRVRGRSPRSESFRRSLKRMLAESYDW